MTFKSLFTDRRLLWDILAFSPTCRPYSAISAASHTCSWFQIRFRRNLFPYASSAFILDCRHRVNNKLAVAQAHKPPNQQFHAYGDGIYVARSHLRSKTGVAAVDHAMNGGRVAIEHHYGENGQYFPFMSMQSKIKLQSGMPLEALYFCTILFRNCLTCLNGNKTSERMNCPPPTLPTYLSW